MPIDLSPHLDPTTTADVELEVQENLLLTAKSVLPGLARHATEIDLIDDLDALAPQPQDVVIEREQGMTGFFSTPLDAYLRNTGVRSLIVTGISTNLGVLGTAIEAMNLGYQVVVPSDCTAGDPPGYVDQLLDYTLRNTALVGPSAAILDCWIG